MFKSTDSTSNALVNGIASGDVTQTTAVLWARSVLPGEVVFDYSSDRTFQNIAGTITRTVTQPQLPVKVALASLDPDTQYYYRVSDPTGAALVGKFATAADLSVQRGLNFGVAGDWRGELAPYSSIRNVANARLDFFVGHGDTIYADVASPALTNPDGSRKGQATTLEDFWTKHDEVYGNRFDQNVWAKIRQSTPILATIDDHEVTNDFSGGAKISSDRRFRTLGHRADYTLINDSPLFENGLQAFQDYNPLRDDFYGATGDPRTAGERKLYRANTYGSDAAVFLLDARSFRDQPLRPFSRTFAEDSLTQDRTMLGQAQLADLKNDLAEAQANNITWKFVMVPEPIQNLGPIIPQDRFEGYAKERTDLLSFIDHHHIDNVVFIAADIHGTVVNNLTYQTEPEGEQIATSAFEITTGSVAYDKPLGQTVAGPLTTLLPKFAEFYENLPIAPDRGDFPNDKDDVLKQIFNRLILEPNGLDPVGLKDNLPAADGLINAKLLRGDYFAAHTYGWTQFDIDPLSQKLTVTTYGIEPYSEAELLENTDDVLRRQPRVVSKFEVLPHQASLQQGIADRSEPRMTAFATADTTTDAWANVLNSEFEAMTANLLAPSSVL